MGDETDRRPYQVSCLNRDIIFQVHKFLANLTYPAKPLRCACGFKYFLVAALKARTDTISKASADMQLKGGGWRGRKRRRRRRAVQLAENCQIVFAIKECHFPMPEFNSGMRRTLLLTPLLTFYRFPYLISP